MARPHRYAHNSTSGVCGACGHSKSHSNHAAVSGGEMVDGGWPIFDELSFTRACSDYQRLEKHGLEHPEDVIVSRIPEIEQHIIKRAVELDLFNELPFALRQRATGRVLDVLMGDIVLLADEMAQLARETGSASSDGGAG